MNSNTSGADVANVGFWPAATLPAVVEALQQINASFAKVADEDAQLAQVDFAALAGSDKISDPVMQEISRRLIVTVENTQTSNIVYSATAPADKTKAWIKTNATTGLPLNGVVYTWSDSAQDWVPAPNQGVYVPPEKRFVKKHIAAGASTVNFDFDTDIKTSLYFPTLTFTTQNEDGTWSAAPGSYPTAFGYLITNQTNITCTVAFYAVPTGGMMAHLQVEAIPQTA